MFSLNNVSKSFGNLQVLKPTTVDFHTGESTVLIGPSGCGKSTLLRILVGLIDADAGTILFDGTPLTVQNIQQQRQRMGYVIQDGGLFPHLTARQNVGLLASHLGWDQAKVKARVEELAELTRLPRVALDRYPSQISGGQRQRVGIMRALMLDPAVMLLDEPMGALDPLVRFDLQEDLRKIFRTLGKTSIMVTHDMGEAAFFGDRVMMLGEGEVVQEGRLEELIQNPTNEYVARFINAQRIPQS
ncbi:MAG: ATP-binding cassette domain-containing protein [Planctomycetota bacterium]|nr:ATP-binding cassette domain-containing protein [Planctomycetota bacterium]